MKIRDAKISDLDAITRIEKAAFPHPYSKEFLAFLLQQTDQINLVAEESHGQIIGYCFTRIEGRRAHMLSIAVLPERRRRGTGTRLMQETLKRVEAQCNELFLEVRRHNKSARRFYDDLGFKRHSLMRGYYENGDDAIVYRKSI